MRAHSGSRRASSRRRQRSGVTLVMLGAIGKKVFVWHTDFGARRGGMAQEWMLIPINLVIRSSDGGKIRADEIAPS